MTAEDHGVHTSTHPPLHRSSTIYNFTSTSLRSSRYRYVTAYISRYQYSLLPLRQCITCVLTPHSDLEEFNAAQTSSQNLHYPLSSILLALLFSCGISSKQYVGPWSLLERWFPGNTVTEYAMSRQPICLKYARKNQENKEEWRSFLDLPENLVFKIIIHLQAVDFMVLRLTCRKFFYSLKNLLETKGANAQDLFYFACRLERDGILPANVFACSGCMDLHEANAFSGYETLLPAENRECLGSQRVFFIKHQDTFTLRQLRQWLRVLYNSNLEKMLPPAGNDQYNVYPILHAGSPSPFISYKFYVADILDGTIPTCQQVAAVLQMFDVPICPHLKTSNPIVVAAYQLLPKREFRPYDGTGKRAPYRYTSNFKVCSCPTLFCQTNFIFKIAHGPQGDGEGVQNFYPKLYLNIARKIEFLDRHDGPAWMAQSIEPLDVFINNANWVMVEERVEFTGPRYIDGVDAVYV